MKKIALMFILVNASFLSGFTVESIINNKKQEMKKVTGIGGIFFKCKDPKAVNEWYRLHLGFDMTLYGTSFDWLEAGDGSKKGLTQWNTFSEDTKYFVDEIESFDYGKFIHILDPEGNKIQLWEPKN
jgi:hypothetical protein